MKANKRTSLAMRMIRKKRIFPKVKGTDDRVRVGIFISNTQISAQAIDDNKGMTRVSISVKGKTVKDAKEAGKKLAELLLKKKLTTCVFDRAGYRYHGRVRAFAEALRESGIHV